MDLVKTVGEGDWGEKFNTEEPRPRGGDDHETEFLALLENPQPTDFQDHGPPCLPGGQGKEEAKQAQHSPGPRPGPSLRPMSAADPPADIQHRMLETGPPTASGDIKPGGGRPSSVTVQTPGAQHPSSGDTVDITGEYLHPTSQSSGRAHKPLDRSQSRHQRGLFLRHRDTSEL